MGRTTEKNCFFYHSNWIFTALSFLRFIDFVMQLDILLQKGFTCHKHKYEKLEHFGKLEYLMSQIRTVAFLNYTTHSYYACYLVDTMILFRVRTSNYQITKTEVITWLTNILSKFYSTRNKSLIHAIYDAVTIQNQTFLGHLPFNNESHIKGIIPIFQHPETCILGNNTRKCFRHTRICLTVFTILQTYIWNRSLLNYIDKRIRLTKEERTHEKTLLRSIRLLYFQNGCKWTSFL